jgi:7-carboxy-7-deazaguanine synthase
MNDTVPGFLNEVFISIQGEGSWVGKRQLFIRFAGCAQCCPYCDTKKSWKKMVRNWVWNDSNECTENKYENPVQPLFFAELIRQKMREHSVDSVAITGGEPLEQPEFLLALIKGLKKSVANVEIMLETNGLEHKAMQKLEGEYDFVAMDIKLPSIANISNSMKKHGAFLRSVGKYSQGCVKVVFGPQTPLPEIVAAAKLAKRYQPSWDFILQPISGPNWNTTKNQRVLENCLASVAKVNSQLRLIPQLHKVLNIK